MLGLGATLLPDSVINYQVPVPASPTTPTGGGNVLDSILNFVNKVAPTVQTVKTTVDQFKSGGTGVPSGGLNTNNYVQPPAPAGMSTNTKLALAVGGTALVGGLLYAVTKKKKRRR